MLFLYYSTASCVLQNNRVLFVRALKYFALYGMLKQIAAKRQNSNISNTGNSPSIAQSNYNIPVTPLSTADSVIIQKLHETAQPLLESDIELEQN